MTLYNTDIDFKEQAIYTQETFTTIKAGESLTYEGEMGSFSTEVTKINKKDIEEIDLEYKTDEKILSAVKGVILDKIDEKVKTKIGEDLIIYFPLQLFSDPEIVKYGQQFIYQIKVDKNGYRSQNFVIDENIIESDEKKILFKKIESI